MMLPTLLRLAVRDLPFCRLGGPFKPSFGLSGIVAPKEKIPLHEIEVWGRYGSPLKPKHGLTPIPCHAVLVRSACAPFIKERRMECINATSLRRKSGQMGHPKPWLLVHVQEPVWLGIGLALAIQMRRKIFLRYIQKRISQ